jgi:hypothetical protein
VNATTWAGCWSAVGRRLRSKGCPFYQLAARRSRSCSGANRRPKGSVAILKERERAAYRRGIMRIAALALFVIGLVK